MKIRHLVAVATLFGLLQDSPAQNAGAVGVLIGLHVWGTAGEFASPPTSLEGGSLKTLWIPISDGRNPNSRDVASVQDLVLPRRAEFWRAGLVGSCTEQPRESVNAKRLGRALHITDHLWFAPATVNPTAKSRPAYPREAIGSVGPCRMGDVYCTDDSRTHVEWIWPEYASLNSRGEYSCGAYPSVAWGLTLRRIDDARTLTLPEALGPEALVRMRAAYEAAKREYLRSWPDYPEDEVKFNPLSWHIRRQAGRWSLDGWADTMRIYGYGFDYTADYDLSKITGRRGEDLKLLEQVKRSRPQVEDAHSGPFGWVLAVSETELLVIPPARSAARALRVPISDFEKVVMVEWATGPHVERWSREVAAARPVNPVIIRD